ncbi:phage tail tube protein [Leuconostoc pseudomesenteroides]|uniref:phage tail tube protein n=1 Tax=Leuconostoc pseudomesenteroides TaxID=33968 RepID=UPI00403D6174
MARNKNALRKSYIAAFTGTTAPSNDAEWKQLAHWISSSSNETDEDTDDTGFYDGDGSKETNVTGVSLGYSFEGFYDAEDPAQKLIADMRLKTGDGRKVWFKSVSSDGKTQWVGRATVTDITAGEGDATDYEAFKATIKWDTTPDESTVPPEG